MEEVTTPVGTQKSSGTQVGSAPSPPPVGAATMGGVEAPTNQLQMKNLHASPYSSSNTN
ncbi:hypothetical protein SESBI_43809 [Sesbania bispinosa]|nr:hypothetical protein SESBI_43809 [Sesbania bispinosa]